MTAFGLAMEKTGTAEWLASLVVGALEPMGGVVVLGGFVLLTAILTQPMSERGGGAGGAAHRVEYARSNWD